MLLWFDLSSLCHYRGLRKRSSTTSWIQRKDSGETHHKSKDLKQVLKVCTAVSLNVNWCSLKYCTHHWKTAEQSCLLHSLVRYQVEHLKRNAISTCTHVLSSMYVLIARFFGRCIILYRDTAKYMTLLSLLSWLQADCCSCGQHIQEIPQSGCIIWKFYLFLAKSLWKRLIWNLYITCITVLCQTQNEACRQSANCNCDVLAQSFLLAPQNLIDWFTCPLGKNDRIH